MFSHSSVAEIQTDKARFTISEKILASLPEKTAYFPETVRTNHPQYDSISFAIKDEKGVRVYFNNTPSAPYDNISKLSTIYSPDGRKSAFIARKKNKSVTVYNGTESKPFDAIANLVFSPDSNSLSFFARNKSSYYLIKDNIKGPEFDGVKWAGYPLFSPDSKRMAYPVFKEGKWAMYLDGDVYGGFDKTGASIFSPDSNHFAFCIKKNNKWHVSRDNQLSDSYDSIKDLRYSPDSSYLAFVATTGEKSFMVIDSVKQKKHQYVGPPLFSPDSTSLAYSVKKGDKSRIILSRIIPKKDKLKIKTEKHSWYRYTGPYKFSPDGKSLSYIASERDRAYVILNGKESVPYESVTIPIFSNDSKNITYKAKKGENQVVVLNNKEIGEHLEVIMPFFSPDSKRLAYIAKDKNGKKMMVVDGITDQKYDNIGFADFSPDSNHIVYQAMLDNKWFFVVDGQPLNDLYYGFIKNCPIKFTNNNSFHCIAIKFNPYVNFIMTQVSINK